MVYILYSVLRFSQFGRAARFTEGYLARRDAGYRFTITLLLLPFYVCRDVWRVDVLGFNLTKHSVSPAIRQ